MIYIETNAFSTQEMSSYNKEVKFKQAIHA